ncbi:MAG: LPS export ABC transporter periplasmic protein LptC [Betaproteobacteria bacterium]|nr:LPS export ABC transporter periplasmic protein LptC [Betaproteobacteria bacterium]MDE2212270.1 LPS export ABC transporter periplasmic protein LptC [Betaproteobacteria bacterium]MDE2353623.1 LPS export ABC transporter periplasmic protein LptC [Betaproteobacteria bacterium]MDE2623922.1 LPS export ABC transporter periplasmic protein LptC [Betaproteobacteria bacterium]
MAKLTHNLEAWTPVVVVLLLAMVTAWLWRVVENNPLPEGRRPRHDPDLIMERFAARQLGEQGQVRYTLNAQKMVHYPDDDTSHFDDVVFTSLEADAPPVTVRSEHAVRSAKQDEVVFTGNVVVTRDPTRDQPLAVVRTSILKVYPQKGIGISDQPVVIHYGKNTLTALSMIVNNKTRIAEFTRAKVTYLPPPRRP